MERSHPPVMSSAGFRASLHSASLPEFIQLGGAAGGRAIYRVVSEGRVGFLYLDAGQVVHATAQRKEGEDAAFEILRWEGGTIESWPGPWPARTTIRMSPQTLLLQAAYREDEGRRLIPLELHRREDSGHEDMPGTEDPMTSFESLLAEPGISDAVLVDRDGVVQLGKGPVQDELAAMASYAAMLADLVGEALGVEGFVGLDASFGEAECALRKAGHGWSLTLGRRGTTGMVPWRVF